MKSTLSMLAVGLLVTLAISGCFGGSKDDKVEPTDPGKLDENAFYDSVVANDGFQVRGGPTGNQSTKLGKTANDTPSAVTFKVVNEVESDTEGANDKADFLMDAKPEGGVRVQALIKSMITGKDVQLPLDLGGGVQQNIQVFGNTSNGPKEFPQTKAYMAAYGQAILRLDGSTVDGRHVFIAMVTKAIHDSNGALLATPDDKRLELHVYFPGAELGADFAIPGVTEGKSLYFFFTTVKLTQLTPAQKADVGSDLSPPIIPNQPPIAVAKILVNGKATNNGTKMGSDSDLVVVLDATNSTDPDGNITTYTWDIREFKNNTTIVKLATLQGPRVEFNFTTFGVKLVTLRIIDDGFAPSEDSSLFYVNYQVDLAYTFPATQPAGAGTDCQQAINCHSHQISMAFGAQKAVFTYSTTTASQCQTVHLNLYDPNGAAAGSISSGNTLTISDKSKLSVVGQYKLDVWFTAQAQCAYKVVAAVTYLPA
jgi:hypothetical protein